MRSSSKHEGTTKRCWSPPCHKHRISSNTPFDLDSPRTLNNRRTVSNHRNKLILEAHLKLRPIHLSKPSPSLSNPSKIRNVSTLQLLLSRRANNRAIAMHIHSKTQRRRICQQVVQPRSTSFLAVSHHNPPK